MILVHIMFWKPVSLAFTFTLTASALFAQDGRPAGDAASAPPSSGVNTEAWDSFISFNGDRIMGDPSEHSFTPSATVYSSFTSVGKRINKGAVIPAFSTSGPLFGGDGYATLSGVIPFESGNTYQIGFVGGWKYRLLEWLDVDVGGGMAFYDKNAFGAGQVSNLGSYYRSALYFGLIVPVPLNPSVYAVYDTQLEQFQVIISISERMDLTDNLSLFVEARGGQLSSQSYLGGSEAPIGGKWKNGYTYWLTAASLDWEVIENTTVSVGVGYTGNNDGTVGIYGLDLGPENTVYGSVGLSYTF